MSSNIRTVNRTVFGMVVGKKKEVFFKTWLGVAKCLWRYKHVHPNDHIEVIVLIDKAKAEL
jgi:hypothetical protein